MKSVRIFSVLAIGFLVAGCDLPPERQELTPLALQSIQAREFEAPKDVVFASIVSVFQDLGYSITAANKDTGFITAESATTEDASLLDIFIEQDSSKQTRATAFVEQIGEKTRARLNFVHKRTSSGIYGQSSQRDTPITDSTTYQNAFNRIESAIFVRMSNR